MDLKPFERCFLCNFYFLYVSNSALPQEWTLFTGPKPSIIAKYRTNINLPPYFCGLLSFNKFEYFHLPRISIIWYFLGQHMYKPICSLYLLAFLRGQLYHFEHLTGQQAVVAEWLRRLTRNQFPSGSVGSNPANCDTFGKTERKQLAPGEARTHNPGISFVLSISTVR